MKARGKGTKAAPAGPMFTSGEELPLFSGEPIAVYGERFEPAAIGHQELLPGMPPIDFEHARRKLAAKRRPL